MKPNIEQMECIHHEFCCQNELFSGCGKCKRFVYERQDHLRNQIEMSKDIIIPYDYAIIFDPSISLFRFVGRRSA